MSELSSPASSPFQPLVKSTLLLQIVLMIYFVTDVQSSLCAASIYDVTYKPLSFLCKSHTFYTNYFAVTTAIIMIINCVASDVRYLWKFGAYLKNYVDSHPDGMNVQLLKYFIRKLLQV